MFTTNHFIWLGISAALIVILLILSLKLKFSFKTCAFILFFVSIASELIKVMNNIIENPYAKGFIIDPTELPLHLCSIMIFVYFALPFMKESKLKETLKSYVAVVGLIGPICALLIPTVGTDFVSIQVYQYFIYHASMIFFSIYLMSTAQVNLKFTAYVKNIAITFCLAIIMIWINGAMSIYGTNFFFVVRPPMENLPIINLNNGWHVYFLTLVGIGILTITLVHLPSLIKQMVDKRRYKNGI